MASYAVNAGVGKPAEFKGLKSQYLFLFAGGLLGVFILFVILYMAGVPQLVCITIGVGLAGTLVYSVFRLNEKYGQYGLMKAMAVKKHPRFIISRKRIQSLFYPSNTEQA